MLAEIPVLRSLLTNRHTMHTELSMYDCRTSLAQQGIVPQSNSTHHILYGAILSKVLHYGRRRMVNYEKKIKNK